MVVAFRDHGNPTRDEEVQNDLRRGFLIFGCELSELDGGGGFSLHVFIRITRGHCIGDFWRFSFLFFSFWRGGVGAYQRIL